MDYKQEVETLVERLTASSGGGAPKLEDCRGDNKLCGKICAHEIADAFHRDPRKVAEYVSAMPDFPPGFDAALEWTRQNCEEAVPALISLRRHYVVKAWREVVEERSIGFGKKKKIYETRFKTDTPALDAAWQQARRYAEMFASQEEPEGTVNPMLLASVEDCAISLIYMQKVVRDATERAKGPSYL